MNVIYPLIHLVDISKYMYSRLSQAATSTSAKAHLHPIFTSGSAKYPVLTHVCPSFPNISTLNQRQTETLAPLISYPGSALNGRQPMDAQQGKTAAIQITAQNPTKYPILGAAPSGRGLVAVSDTPPT
ncbi:uncharacterized protein TRIREDRAFT_111222 [Trichoderma reesei QM6a]|uniref:Predicted protein n=2 Tax=Hypocrea jecorina TaxID=51453 RepID=G0RU84_HYPJQ|nr:uncharacterized protein TRIREDRAFT_111222 [Trichoderma reesei QM6a]EGR45275.1 predicted protein [Trichoderma reesei QM6a]ETR98078.1 hypothetical protein M419DRAFT_89873 [Trichoderma reesei RUT C-30]